MPCCCGTSDEKPAVAASTATTPPPEQVKAAGDNGAFKTVQAEKKSEPTKKRGVRLRVLIRAGRLLPVR